MKQELKVQVYKEFLERPDSTDYEIAERLNLSRSAVWRARNKVIRSIDYKLAASVAGKFLVDFQMASDYWKKQISELEDQKSKPNKVLVMTKDGPQEKEVPKSDAEIREIMRQQEDLWKNILFLARQGEAVEVLRLMEAGRIPIPDQSRKEDRPSQ